MSELNKNILQQANAAVSRGDNEGFLAFCTDDLVWSTVGGETLRGKEAVRAWMVDGYAEPPTFTVRELVAEGDLVVALATSNRRTSKAIRCRTPTATSGASATAGWPSCAPSSCRSKNLSR